MERQEFIELVNSLHYKPGWSFTVTGDPWDMSSPLFDVPIIPTATVYLLITGTVQNSDKMFAPHYRQSANLRTNVICNVLQFRNETEALRHILNALIDLEIHETREFLKVGETFKAPFHPHTPEGNANYSGESDIYQTRYNR